MKPLPLLSLIVLSSVFFTWLFYKESMGINLLIFEAGAIAALLATGRGVMQKPHGRLMLAGTMLTALLTVINHSWLSLVLNWISYFLLMGFVLSPELKSLVSATQQSFRHLIFTPLHLAELVPPAGNKKLRPGLVWHYTRVSIIPVIIFLVFLMIYNQANPFFNGYFNDVTSWFYKLAAQLNLQITGLFLLGLTLASWTLIRKKSGKGTENPPDKLIRVRKTLFHQGMNALKQEYVSAIILLGILNGLLLLVNVTDIYHVWFGFEWSGEYLRQFVHAGTWLLILSILISMGIVLFFYRGNINFYRNNQLLKIFTIIWLAQNAILTISVGVRNFWYIYHFALAYKRIGVIIFLLLTFAGLYFIYKKVIQGNTAFYLVRKTAMATYLVLLLFSFANWDSIIARYNFASYQRSFVHLDYLATLSDKSLPYLIKTREELQEIEKEQAKFDFEHEYMSKEVYYDLMEDKKKEFIRDWKEKSWLSWNYAEYSAYQQISLDN